jgi:hypothetical protein
MVYRSRFLKFKRKVEEEVFYRFMCVPHLRYDTVVHVGSIT